MAAAPLWSKDLTGLPGYRKGNLRGIQGTGNEMFAVGRALKHGLVVFFKAWPDTNYDLVVDNGGILLRVEVKGSATARLALTRGQRSGKQISKTAQKRTRKISRRDCDILIGIEGNSGSCYVVPIDFVRFIPGKTASFKALSHFEERWDFIVGNKNLSPSDCKDGLFVLTKPGLLKVAQQLKLPGYRTMPPFKLVKSLYLAIKAN